MEYSNPNLTKSALLALGCMELKDFVAKHSVGSCFYRVREWQLAPLDAGTPLKMTGYWQFENGNGYKITLHGDSLVMPTKNQPNPSIYAQHGLDKAKHDKILMADIAD